MPTLRYRLALAIAALCGAAPAGARAAAPRPNVLLILVDDLGYGDLTSFGAPDLRTPRIDSIVSAGMRFGNFYANCPVCSPTRAALLSGRYQEMVGVPGVIRTHQRNSWGNLDDDAVLLPALLKQGGYATAMVGKWHLGMKAPDIPTDRGFDFFHGFLGDMMDDYYTHRRHDRNYMRRGTETIDPKGHATDLFSDWACDYLRKQSAGDGKKPFFLYLAYNAPHTPIQPPDEWVDRIQARQPDLRPKRAKLVALIEHMDAGIGRVLDCLRDTGLEENTLVIFTSDNGGQTNVGARNGPVRAGKGTLYEGGLRVPMAARWPGHIKPGTRSDLVALTMDLMPTILAATGIEAKIEIDGRSILPTLLGKSQPQFDRDLFFGRREGGRQFGGRTIECIRRGPWKLLRPRPGAPFELYNLDLDPREQTDLAATEPDRAKTLTAALEAQLARYGAVPWQPAAHD